MIDREKFVSQLREIVAVPGLPRDVETLGHGLDIVESWIDKRANIKRVKNGSAEILLAGNGELLNPRVGYMVHFDVVSAEPDLFEMKVEGDDLKGRGVSDMKFSIPLGVALLNEAIEKGLSEGFTLAITTDEEVGGFEGGKYLVDELKFRPESVIVPDGGDNYVFVEKAKGVCQIIVEASGVAAHSSRTWLGKSANNTLIKFGNALIERYEEQSSKEDWVTTMNIGFMNGGISVNQVADKATMKIDFRYPETVTIQEIFDEIKEIAARISPDLIVVQGPTGLPTIADVNNSAVRKFMVAMEKAGIKLEVKPTFGASDARHFAELKTPILMAKPIGGEIHSVNEWISLSSCLRFYEGLRNFVFDN